MKSLLKTASVVAMAVALGAAGSTGAFAKAHDSGVADGTRGTNSNVGGDTAGKGGNAISGGQKSSGDGKGTRGTAASGAKSDNNGGKGNSDGDGGPSRN